MRYPRIPAHRIDWMMGLFDTYATTMARRAFCTISIKNPDLFQFRNPGHPTLCFSNHCNWWDGIANYLMVSRLDPQARLYVMIEELERLPVLSLFGGFSVEKSSPFAAAAALRYACQLMNQDPRNVLWLYPQGRVYPQEHRPLGFAHGIGHLAAKSPGLNVIPVSQTYTFLREDRPEIFLHVGPPLHLPESTPEEWCRQAEQVVTHLLEETRLDIANESLGEYQPLLYGLKNPYKTLEKKLHSSLRFLGFGHPSSHAVHKPRQRLMP